MVLDYEYLKRNASFPLEPASPFIVLHANHFDSVAERTLFSYTVEVLNCIHSLQRINAIGRELEADFTIDSAILYQAIEHLFARQPFSENQLIAYFETQQALEDFDLDVQEVIQMNFQGHLPYPVDFMLLGIQQAHYSGMEVANRVALHEHYEALFFQMLQKEISVPHFIELAKTMLDTLRG
ncbi:hypothetical protein [Flavobacterium soli]|uniref:hypothetical protein n=1 Tax=Flavobacterium soli TaxID=344881 RepID=UPI0003FB7848|nr:hypothetical protein [Flavobacterium soli]